MLPGVFKVTTAAELRSAVISNATCSLVLQRDTPFLLEGEAITIPNGHTVQIEGHGMAILDAGRSSRCFTVEGVLFLRGITITNGQEQYGGGLMVLPGGSASLSGVNIVNCSAISPGFGSAEGGAFYVHSQATLSLENSAVTQCQALNGQTRVGAAARGGAIFMLGRKRCKLRTTMMHECHSWLDLCARFAHL